MTQQELADRVGIRQIDVSSLENGEPLPRTVKDQKVDKLFRAVELTSRGLHANFVKWWRDNGLYAPRSRRHAFNPAPCTA